MPSLMVVMFTIQLAIHIINSIGASTISDLAWAFYNKLPTPSSGAQQNATKQQRELLRLKRELGAVSAQDDFARWAKLRRQHDKVEADYQKLSSSLSSAKSQFSNVVSTTRWILTTGLRFFLQSWYGKQPMFWVPVGWLPHYVEWILSFPRAPVGSISIQMWSMACAAVFVMVGEALTAAWGLASPQKSGSAARSTAREGKGTPMAMNGQAASASPGSKKDL